MPDNKTRLDPWTFGELHPSGMSHVTQPLRPTGRASPSAAAREGNAVGIAPHPPLLGAPAGCRQMWGWLSRCLPSPLSAWLAGINGGLPRRPPPALASSLTATTTTLPRWAGLCITAHHRSLPDWRAPHREPIHTLTHAHTPAYAHTYTHTYTHTHTCTCTHTHTHTHMHTHARREADRHGHGAATAAAAAGARRKRQAAVTHVSIGTCASPSTSAGCTVVAT